jgi:hypothetical protein
MPQSPGQVAHQRVGQSHQAFRDAPSVHQGAGENEEGHGEQGKGVHARHEALGRHLERNAPAHQDRCESRHAHGDGDRDAQGKEQEQHDDHQYDHG